MGKFHGPVDKGSREAGLPVLGSESAVQDTHPALKEEAGLLREQVGRDCVAPSAGAWRCSVQIEQHVKKCEVRRGLGKGQGRGWGEGGDKSLTWKPGTPASVKTGRSF